MALTKKSRFDNFRNIIEEKIFGQHDSRVFLEDFRKYGPGLLLPLCGISFSGSEEEKVRRFLADFFAGEILEIADTEAENPEKSKSGDRLNRAKLQIETRRWLMERLAPECYAVTSQRKSEKGLKSLFRTKIYLPENGRH